MLWKPSINSTKIYIRVRVYDSAFAKTDLNTSVDITDTYLPDQYLSYIGRLTNITSNLIVNNVESWLKVFLPSYQ